MRLEPLLVCLAIAAGGCGGDEGEGADTGLEVGACTTARSADPSTEVRVVPCDDPKVRSKVIGRAEGLDDCKFSAVSDGSRFCLKKAKPR